VFKAKWRGSIVAVKVVDSDVVGAGGGSAAGGTGATEAAASAAAAAAARESALAQAISHPHVVSTYKVLTVPVSVSAVAAGGGNGGGGGGGGDSGTAPPTGLTPTRADADTPAPTPPAPTLIETWIIQELCDRGSLETAIAAGKFMKADGTRDMPAILSVLRDVAAGMEYLASLGVVHADLKPANILLKSTASDARGCVF
jgi:serine/threonine protein kinase